MHAAFILFKSSRVHYVYSDTGKKLLFFFHGYGESGDSFSILEPFLRQEFNIVAIDLPYHGKTEWNEGLDFSVSDLCEIMEKVCSIHFPSVKIYSIAGYSMGGRIALSLLEEKYPVINKVLLMAPDGFTVNIWYWLATQTAPGRRLFYLTMQKPGWFFSILKIGRRLGMVNQSIYKFVLHYIDDERVRKELYNRWICMRQFKPSLSGIKDIIKTHEVPIRLLYGRHDRIIRPGKGRKFIKGLEKYCQLYVINSGHQVLHIKNAEIIIRLLTT